MKNTQYLLSLFLIILLASACAEPQTIEACVEQEPDGFFSGLIHGLISPVTFIISLFNENVAIYAVNNTGGWYDFGFLLGASIILGGGARSR